MANNFWDKAMNFLGLVVDNEGGSKNNRRNPAADDFARPDRHGKTGTRRPSVEDAFEEEPRISYVPPRGANGSGSTVRRPTPQSDSFEAEDIWGEAPARPTYGTRSGSGTQRGTSSVNYGGNQSKYRSPYQSAPQNEQRSGSNYGDTNYYGGESSMNYNEYGSSGMNQKKQQASSSISMIRIKTVDECKNVIRTLLEKKSVLLSLEEMDSVQAQRVVDTMSGATFAIGAKMNRASARSWLLTPSTVEVDDKHAIQSNTIL
jgi:FtsZ-interacting cell division protein YlmF